MCGNRKSGVFNHHFLLSDKVILERQRLVEHLPDTNNSCLFMMRMKTLESSRGQNPVRELTWFQLRSRSDTEETEDGLL